jgi:hypothetical protein
MLKVLSAELPSDPMTTAAVRAAFAEGLSPESAALMLHARDSGLAWEPLTEAVALGLADHYAGPAVQSPSDENGDTPTTTWWSRPRRVVASTGDALARRPLAALATAAVLYVALRPVLGVGHELTVAVMAWLLHLVVGTGVWEPMIRVLGLDPIYAGAAVRAAGGVQVTGFAVAGPLGAALHNLIPAVFLDPNSVADGAGVSMVATPGSPAIGRGLAAFGADLAWLTFGVWLFWRWRRRRWWLALLGLFVQAQIAVNHLLDAQIGLADIDASGLPFALAVAIPNGGWFTTGLAGMSAPLRDALVGGVLVVLGRLPWFGRLPGDIRIEGEHTRVYVPLVSMLLVSLLLTLVMSLLRRFF